MTEAPDIAATRKLAIERARVTRDQGFVARLQDSSAWNDVGALKRALLDSLTTERNTYAKGIMADVDKQRAAGSGTASRGPASAP